MSANLSQQIQEKSTRLLEAKKRYNSLVKAVDMEFTDKMTQLSESCVHVPLELANTIAKALEERNIKSDAFRSYVQQLSEILEYIDSDISNSSDQQDLSFHDSFQLDEESQSEILNSMNSELNSDNNDLLKNDLSENENDELSLSGDGSGDAMQHLKSMKLDMNQFINQNYNVQDDLDGIGGI
ncbi:hypothetical protein TRFO_22461 [Tritrichomonas foetus]|uniref:Uncharacterized protein n=1 Tax=Tritrichomonas foetus TaxID=1144522 RepID=A0A1J4KGV3_9EUKA|nr:hypothetical protein TRFO_22461 [Tritrichomonas foetus]|eukprot:OHT08878.1 hypothetical protein TRFO_22461 [Tritrichomonas foetus]